MCCSPWDHQELDTPERLRKPAPSVGCSWSFPNLAEPECHGSKVHRREGMLIFYFKRRIKAKNGD